MRMFLLLAWLGLLAPRSQAQTADSSMQWFADAKLGIFIHWGIYAVNGIDESWSFFNHYLDYEAYMDQTEGFTAAAYDPQAWARLIDSAGARYAVLTSKHHDGVALWDSEAGPLNVATRTPAGRDLVGPFVEAIRARDLRVGLYYSHCDWSHPDYPIHTRQIRRYDIAAEPARWERFLAFHRAQLDELLTRYQPDLFWFDGDWEQTAEAWRAAGLRAWLKGRNPDLILNSRLTGYGDYATPEQGPPVTRPEAPYWELCLTMNDSWGYQRNDHRYKTPYQLIRIFADCISMGGNLLLDIGPQADGTIPPEQVATLHHLGRWTHKHAEAIYGTQAGLPPDHFYGPTTLSADSSTLFLFLPHPPQGPIVIKGLKNRINRIRVVGEGTKLDHEVLSRVYWSEYPGLCYIEVPAYTHDPDMTVIAVQLDGPVRLFRE